MAFGDPFADPYGLGGGAALADPFGSSGIRRRRRQQIVASPEEEESWIRSLAGGAISGVAAIGNVIDTPAAFIRDIAVGNNPFEGLISPSKRASGRDVLESWGWAGPNDPNKWEAADFAGFGLEVLADPLLPFGLAGKALGSGGKLAKTTGLLDDLAQVAGPSMGRRQAQVAHSLDDLIALRPGEAAGAELDRLATVAAAAKQQGIDLGEVLRQPLGGAFSYAGRPFGGQRVAGAMDRVADTLAYGKIPGTNFSPGSTLTRLFSAKAGDAGSRVGQEHIMPQLYRAEGEARAMARGVVGDALETLENTGGKWIDEDQHMAVRRVFEGIDAAPTPEFESMVGRVHKAIDVMHQESREWGLKVSDFYDPKAGYFPRFLSTLLKGSDASTGAVGSVFDESVISRLPFLKQITGGTSTVSEIARDPFIDNLIQSGAKTDDIAGYIRQQYGQHVPESFVTTLGQTPTQTHIEFGSRPQAIAEWLQGLSPEARELGVFGNHPIQDLNVRMQNGYEALKTAQTVLTNLANPDIMAAARATSKTRGQTVPMGKLLGELGFQNDAAYKKFAEIADLDQTPEVYKQIAKMDVPKDLADDLTRRMQAFKGPKAVGEIIGAIDSVTNLFKAGVTSVWPAFHTRNLGSGQFQNYVADMFSRRSVAEADALMRGRDVDLRDLPIVSQVYGPNPSPDQAADLVRRLVFQYEVFGKYSGQTGEYGASAAQLAGAQGADLGALLKQFPGGLGGSQALSLSDIPRMAAGIGDEVDWNPLSVRGVGAREESTFGLAVAGEHVGQYVEGLNRLSPFIDQLRKGVSPAEAAKRVAEAQVDYSGRALTTFEREAMTRLMPFYKFSRGAIPFTLRQLWEAPGGKLAQTVRATNYARGTDALTPPEVAEGTSIPLGENTQGDPRYLTRLGLMHEDALGLAGQAISNPRAAALELAGMLNPLLKGPAEYATNQLFFQGGRPLDEAEGRIGRTIANIIGSDKPVWDSRGGTGVLEQVVANSPLSRLSTALGTLTDRRKYDYYGLPVAANLLTGLKVTDVPQQRQDAILRERLTDTLQTDLGARTFSRAFVPQQDLEQMTAAQQGEVAKINALMALLQQRAKERRERAGR